MNKKGAGQLVIFGIPVAVFLVFLFRVWAINEVVEAVQPELEKALLELQDNIVCPPEFDNNEYEICINGKGNIIVNGKVNDDFTIQLSSNTKNNQCTVSVGEYIDKQTCSFGDIHKLENFDLILYHKSAKVVVNSKNIQFYILNNKYIKIPTKKWNYFWRVTRYIPK